MLTCSWLTPITEQTLDDESDSGDSVVFQVEGAQGKNQGDPGKRAHNSQRYRQRLRERAHDGEEAALDVLRRRNEAKCRRRGRKKAGKSCTTASDIGGP